MLSLNDLPFDALCHVFQYLSVHDLHALSTLGPACDEAAQSVALRRHPYERIVLTDYTHDIDYLRSFCAFLTPSVRSLSIEFSASLRINLLCTPLLVAMITDAERLTDLTLVHENTELRFGPRLLARIERLTLHSLTDSDVLVGQLLATSTPGRLVELRITAMSLSGACLAHLTGQLRALHMRDVYRLSTAALTAMVERYPRLECLTVEDAHGKTAIAVPPLVDHLQQVRELRLNTAGLSHLQLLTALPQLRRLRLRLDVHLATDEGGLEAFADAGAGHALRELCLESHGHRMTEAAGRQLHRFDGLERLQLCVQADANARAGVAALLRGLDGHPALRHLQLQSGRGHGWRAVLAAPDVLHRHMQRIETLHVAAQLGAGNLLLLAQLCSLRTLKLCGLPTRRDADHDGGDPMAVVNRLMCALAAQNRLVELHLQVDVGLQACQLEAATIERLAGFTELRVLRLVGRYEWETVSGVLKAMRQLEVFENPGCLREVAEGRTELEQMRPAMRRLRVCTFPESI